MYAKTYTFFKNMSIEIQYFTNLDAKNINEESKIKF